jgi:Protein of unknown function (DUF4232)
MAAAVAACSAALIPGLALAAQQAPAAAARAAAPACETPGLVVWLDTNGSGTAGSVIYNLEFTNLSGHACTVNGFPYIRAISISGHVLGRAAAFSGTPHTVTIHRGHTATAKLQIVDAGNYPPSACHPVTAAGRRVYPPNQTRAKEVPFPYSACVSNGPVVLRVGPLQ